MLETLHDILTRHKAKIDGFASAVLLITILLFFVSHQQWSSSWAFLLRGPAPDEAGLLPSFCYLLSFIFGFQTLMFIRCFENPPFGPDSARPQILKNGGMALSLMLIPSVTTFSF